MIFAKDVKVGDFLFLEVGKSHSYETFCEVLFIETQYDMWDSNKTLYRFKVHGLKKDFFTKLYEENDRLTIKN